MERVDWTRALSIALSIALYNLYRVYRAKWQAHKAARTEIPVYRNWRGVYVPDLHLIRIRRAVVTAWVLFFGLGFVWSVYLLW